MNNEKTLDGALCADVGTADAEGAVPAAGRKKYVPPTMQVIPLDPQRLLATSGGLPIYDSICTGKDYDKLIARFPDGDANERMDESRRMLTSEYIMSDPVGFVSWADARMGLPGKQTSPVGVTIYGLPGRPTLGELLQSAVLTNVTSQSRVGKYNSFLHTVDWTVILEGSVPGEYSFTVYGSYGSGAWYLAGGEHCYSEYG